MYALTAFLCYMVVPCPNPRVVKNELDFVFLYVYS